MSSPTPEPVPGPTGPHPARPDLVAEGARPRPRALEDLATVRFLTVAEVAAVMRVSRMTVYRLVHAEELACVRVGRSFRVPERAVHDYLRAAYTEAG